jgi:hypothetical protein
MKAMGAMMQGSTGTPTTVDFRELKALLPAALDGFKRVNASGEKNSAMGMTISEAKGEYENGEGGSLHISITDNGGIAGFMGFAAAAWASQEIDSESDTGFERTAMYGAHKAKEEYDNEDKSGQIETMVGSRFMVKVNGYEVPFETLQAALKQVDLDKLAGLKPKPAP